MSLRTAFHRTRLDPIGAFPDPVGGHRLQQRIEQSGDHRALSEDQRRGKAVDRLKGACEAELAGTSPTCRAARTITARITLEANTYIHSSLRTISGGLHRNTSIPSAALIDRRSSAQCHRAP